ncbi:hypothetical protein ACFSWE_04625 [Leucobacter albus]|uniref:LPXTG-motif cell wall-anchored protein n=1 Tax=Leucobacter albus TaxID=272210 RepID=A0ABW3TIK3_9MICO
MTVTTPTRRGRARRRVLAALLAAPLMLPAAVTSAQAASLEGMFKFGTYEIGGFGLADGSLAYCLEPGAQAPLSDQLEPVRVTELPGYSIWVDDQWGWRGQVTTAPASGEVLRQLNWVLAEHGDTQDQQRAVAVQIALWELRRGPGNEGWIEGKYEMFRSHGGAPHIEAGKRLAAEARTQALGPGNAFPEGELKLDSVDEHGNGTVSYPAGTTALTIEGGVFAGGETELTVANGKPGTVEWSATPHEPAWQRFNDVTIRADWALAEKYWPAELIVHPSTQHAEQRLGAGVTPVVGENRGELAPVVATFDARFAPTLGTQVPEEIVTGAEGVFRDRVSVGVAEGRWPTRGDEVEPLPLLADGVLFGPFAEPQAETDFAPTDAPIAARATLDISRGPGDYEAELALAGAAAGYYYWVWSIAEERQSDEIRASEVLELGAVFADRFGVLTERQIVPTELRWETRLVQHSVSPDSRELIDRVRATLLGGEWLRDETGERLRPVIRLTFYQLDSRPTQQPDPPAAAREIGEVRVALSAPDTWEQAPPFVVPDAVQGWVAVRACLFDEDQAPEIAGKFVEWCDDFGVPDETAQVVGELAATGAVGPAPWASREGYISLGVAVAGVGGLCLGLLGMRRKRALLA